ncbi:hypothetical protein HKD37_20G055813 [Glycine soja]
MHSQGDEGCLEQPPFCLFIRKRGRRLSPSSPRRAGLLPPEATKKQPCFENILKGPKFENLKIAICTPYDKFTPFLS